MTKTITRTTWAALALAFASAAACGGSDTPTSPFICSAPEDVLDVGQVTIMDTTQLASCAFLADSSGAEYLVIPFTANFEEAGDFLMTLDGSRVSLASSGAPALAASASEGFHARLRHFEMRVAERGLPKASPSAARLAQAPMLGQVDSFWVIQEIDDLDRVFSNPQPGDFERIGATLKFIGTNTLLYVDDQAPGGGLTDPELTEIGQIFDAKLYPLDVQTFGAASDVDGDDKVTVLLSPYVNALTPAMETSFIAGFFFPLDLFSTSTPNCPICAFSNERELFYGLVADPDGDFSGPRPTELVKSTLPAVMIHELQHMISFNQRVFLRPGLPEVLWLSEALAHLAEELGGDLFEAEGDLVRADEFHDQNLIRALFYLEEPWPHSLTAIEGGGTLEERGAGWLFVRWLGEQYGNTIFRRLVQTTDEGTVNVERRTGAEFFDLFGEFAITLYTDDLSISGLSSRYQIPKWALRTVLRSGGVYALQPATASFTQLRTGSISQTLESSSPYHVLVNADGSGGLTLQLDFGANPKGGVAIVRTN